MNLLISIIGAVLAISIIIVVHEFGHYWVARRCKVFVESFSIGFGPCIYSRTTKTGMLFRIGCLPIGGYIKMQGDEYSPNQKADQHHYLSKPVWQRMLIILAGPFINFLLTIVLYSLIYSIGFPSIKPIIQSIQPHSIAAKAGLKAKDQIISVNHYPTAGWPDAILTLLIHYGDTRPISLTIKRQDNFIHHTISLSQWQITPESTNLLATLGITALKPTPLPVIDRVLVDSPAAHAKLQPQDRIIAINQQPIHSMAALHQYIQKNAAKAAIITIQRRQQQFNATITPQQQHFSGKPVYLLGFIPKIQWPAGLKTTIQYAPMTAIGHAIVKTKLLLALNISTFYKLLTGQFSFQFLGGPFSIFVMGGKSTLMGIIPYLAFIAYISVAIGFLNLLPIPGLDGGHFLFQLIELIKGKPVSLKTQTRAITIGIGLLLLLMIAVTIQDISKLF